MTCREIEQMIIPYIHDELTEHELEEFILHISECENCKEELEIYYMLNVGLKQLDEGGDVYNMKGALEEAILETKNKLYAIRLRMIAAYAANTLGCMSIVICILLQLRIWWQNGLLF